MSQHIKNYLNGTYYVYDNRSLDKGEKRYVYNPNKNGLEDFIARLSEIHEMLDEYFKKIVIFLAPLDGFSREDLYKIEAKLTSQIYGNLEFGQLLDSPRPRVENSATEDIKIVSRGQTLPKEF